MTKRQRLLAMVVALAALAVVILSRNPGQTGGKIKLDKLGDPRPGPDKGLEILLADSKFTAGGVLTYQPLKGDLHFALQIKPKLDKTPARPRDILIMINTSAAMAGESFRASYQLAEAMIKGMGKDDRIALWTVSTPGETLNLTKDFLAAKEKALDGGKNLTDSLAHLKDKAFPAGDTDLKSALTKAIASFDGPESRQRIFLFLGDGQSTHNPIDGTERLFLGKEMARAKVGFFPVPMGASIHPENLHGLATATGGLVLRTAVDEEKVIDAVKRYHEAFDQPILYDAKMALPANVLTAFPKVLPPLRPDAPTLVMGTMKPAKTLDWTITGKIGGTVDATVKASEAVKDPEIDNYFLLTMVNQWSRASDLPAMTRADRALALCYKTTTLHHDELLLAAGLALEKSELPAATKLYERALLIHPADMEARVGLKLVAHLSTGALSKDMIREGLKKGRDGAMKLEVVDGKPRWVSTEVAWAFPDEKDGAPPVVAFSKELSKDALKAFSDRLIIEETHFKETVDKMIRTARDTVKSSPEGAVDMLKDTLLRVMDHPDLSPPVRTALTTRLENEIAATAGIAKTAILLKRERALSVGIAIKEKEREAERRTMEERIDSQYKVFRSLMDIGRLEEGTRNELLAAFKKMENDARLAGEPVPVVAQAAYEQIQVSYNLNQYAKLKRRREEGFLNVLLEVERSNIAYADEPPIHFPPLKAWEEISKRRKAKYEVSSLPDDDKGRDAAKYVESLLKQEIELSFDAEVPLKAFLEILMKKMKGRDGREVSIIVFKKAFMEEEGTPDPEEAMVKFPAYPKRMAIATALRLALEQVPPQAATYLIRRDYIEITTIKRQLQERVLRVYPVGDLVIPISQLGGGGGQQGGFGGGGGFPGGGGGGFPGGGGGFGGGFPGGGGGGFPGGGGFGGGFPGGGGAGGGGCRRGGGGGGGGSFVGGSFTGGFNGSLGAQGASQAVGLIDVITRVVDPGSWFLTQQLQPFNPFNMFPGLGMGGLMGGGLMMGGGFMMGGGMMMGLPAPPPAVIGPTDPRDANTIEFFPPTLALIVRAPTRLHTSIHGGVLGGRLKGDALVRLDGKGDIRIADAGDVSKDPLLIKSKDPMAIVKIDTKKGEEVDATKVWNEALAKGPVDPGMVVATADFLFQTGNFKHAAEFLKANLRQGIVVRPWVYEALAVALEASKASPEEVRRARLSAVALDPTDATGFLSAARAMADHKQYDRALAFCRQAALLEPNLAIPYSEALAFADLGKDSKAMEWAVSQLLSRDWPADNKDLHDKAETRLKALADTLVKDGRKTEGEKLKAILAHLKERDLVINLSWDTFKGPAELVMEVIEPTGSVCSTLQRQTAGGGIFLGSDLTELNRNAYVAAQAFNGEYTIKVKRLWGTTLGNPKLEIIQNEGSAKSTRRLEMVKLEGGVATFKVKLTGRRTELATVAPPALHKTTKEELGREAPAHVLTKLRDMAFYDFSTTKAPSGFAGTPGSRTPSGPPVKIGPTYKAPAVAVGGAGMQFTAEVRLTPGSSEPGVALRPVFETLSGGRGLTLPLIPGAAP